MTGEALLKMAIRLEPGGWCGLDVENVWVEPLGGGRYRLQNTPFYAFGLAAEDVVTCQDRDARLWFTKAVSRGGHSSYRIIRFRNVTPDTFKQYWKPLESLGCSYESDGKRYYAVDVPPEVDTQAAYKLFEKGHAARVWDFEEGYCGHAV